MNPRLKKLALLALPVVFIGILAPNITHAGFCSLGSPSTWFDPQRWIPCAFYAVTSVVAYLLGAALVVAAWILDVVMRVNQLVTATPAVTTGFGITLGLTNLGFVFGIIVIAIATIIRYQTYGMKQILWKLVVMAILVNFSMTIAGSILGFADGFTTYFLNRISPDSIGNFSENYAAAFHPEKFIKPTSNTSGLLTTLGGAALGTLLTGGIGGAVGGGIIANLVAGDSGGLAALLGTIAAALLAIVFLIITIVTMGATIIMLLIRYVALGILLVLMPLAWLCWVFPDLQSYWSKWWHNFIRWTFFAPVVTFFIYLAILTSTQQQEFTGPMVERLMLTSKASQVIDKEFWGQFFAGFTAIIGNQVIIIGLMIGGLFAANSLGIMGASGAMSVASSATKAFGGYVGTKTLAGVSRPFRGEGGIAQRLQRWASAPDRGTVGRFVGGLAARPAARLAAAGGEDLVKQYEKEVAGMSRGEMMAAALTAFGARKIALQRKLAGMGEIDLKQTHTEANQRLWEAHGMKQAYNKEVEVPSGMTAEIYQMKKKQLGGDTSITPEAIQDKYETFLRTLTKADAAKIAAKDVMSTDAKGAMGESREFIAGIQPHFVRGMVSATPDHVASVLPKLKGSQLDAFQEQAEAHLESKMRPLRETVERLATGAGRSVEEMLKLPEKELEALRPETQATIREFRRLTSVRSKLNNAVGANAMFGAPETSGAPPQAPPLTGIPKSPTTA